MQNALKCSPTPDNQALQRLTEPRSRIWSGNPLAIFIHVSRFTFYAPCSSRVNRESQIVNRTVPEASATPPATRNPWAWIPTLYFAEGIPYALVTAVSIVLYKDLGVSNARITFISSWLTLPWIIKPLWSPVVDILRTRRLWICGMQLLLALAVGGGCDRLPPP